MRVFVTGVLGQLATSLREAGPRRGVEIVAVEQPELDLARPETVETEIARASPALVVNTAAYTAVDLAESEPTVAHAVNADGAGAVAAACNGLGIPIIHISTDYVFDGSKAGPYDEEDSPSPVSVYGWSKLEGERQVASACPRHIILRTAWLFSPFGHNFLRTMLRLAETKPEIGVVADQTGNPTFAPHLAEAVLDIACQVLADPQSDRLFGTYHAAASGKVSWHGFAEEIFRHSRQLGGPAARVRAIATAEYPTAARRPAHSDLDCSKLERVFGTRLPSWQAATRECVTRLVGPAAERARIAREIGAAQ